MSTQWNVTFQFISKALPNEVREVLETFFMADIPPSAGMLEHIIEKTNDVLMHENKEIRPADKKKNPGGLIDLSVFIKTTEIYVRYVESSGILMCGGIGGVYIYSP